MAKKKIITQKILDKIFKDPLIKYGLKEFEDFAPNKVLEIFEKDKNLYYLKDFKSGKERLVWNENKISGKPEEIIRQLWLFKLNKHYGYPLDRIDTEKDIRFGREIHAKAADIIVYKKDKITPYIIIEVKNPTEQKGVDQLKTYLNAEGCEIGVWSNGVDRVILYRPYPKEFSDTLPDIPPVDKTIDDILEEKKTLFKDTSTKENLKRIIELMEELVLANAGVDVFNEVFKLIYAKLFDEEEAKKVRKDQEIFFRKYKEPEKTYEVINNLFKKAISKWPGIFYPQEKIELSPDHLSVVVGELQKVRLFGSDLSIVDEAFEYLIPEVAKGKKGQYFTPRHVIDIAVKMLSSKKDEYVIDPAAGSGGFLIHTMFWNWANDLKDATREAQIDYAKTYLWGIDFDEKMSKVSRALMLIAGDGKTHIFRLNSLDPREWHGEGKEQLEARAKLKERLYRFDTNPTEDAENQKNFKYFDFDILLTNPPFAGEIRDQGILRQYFLGKNKKGKYQNKVERHILFIERALDFIRPGGRMAIVLPQGVLNNTNMEYVREFLFDKARILAVVGLHGNTFKPHTGTKTSILFLQKWQEGEKLLSDYPIFMAVSKKAGKDNSGNYVYKKDASGNIAYDSKGRKILDHDLDEVADAFIDFAKKQKFGFWK